MSNCMNEIKCHKECTKCDEFIELEEQNKVLTTKCNSYELERISLLEANWELQKKIVQAEKQINEDLKDLAFCKNYLIEFKNEYDQLNDEFLRMCNHAKTLEATLPKER